MCGRGSGHVALIVLCDCLSLFIHIVVLICCYRQVCVKWLSFALTKLFSNIPPQARFNWTQLFKVTLTCVGIKKKSWKNDFTPNLAVKNWRKKSTSGK